MKITIPKYWPFTLTVPGLSLITLVPPISMRNGISRLNDTYYKIFYMERLSKSYCMLGIFEKKMIICGAWVYNPNVLAKGPLLPLIWTMLEHRMWWNPSLTTQKCKWWGILILYTLYYKKKKKLSLPASWPFAINLINLFIHSTSQLCIFRVCILINLKKDLTCIIKH